MENANSTPEMRDNWDMNSEEVEYWQKNVSPYIANGSVNGNYMWNYAGPYSHNVDSRESKSRYDVSLHIKILESKTSGGSEKSCSS